MVIAGFGSILVTVVKSVFLLGFVVSFQGAAMGGLDCGANVMLIYAWRDQVGPWMQAMHASFAVGAFFAPMLIRAVQGDVADPASPDATLAVGSGAYKPAFVVMGVVCMVCGLLIVMMKSPKPRTHGSSTAATGQTGQAGSAALPAGAPGSAGAVPQLSGVPLPVGSVGGPLGSPASHGSLSLSIALFNSPSQQQTSALSVASLDSGIAIEASPHVAGAGIASAASPAVTSELNFKSYPEDAAWGGQRQTVQLTTPAKGHGSSSGSGSDGFVDAVVCAPAGEVAVLHHAHQPPAGTSGTGTSSSGAHTPVPELPVSELPQNLRNDRLSAVLIVACLLGLYVGAETSYGAFLTSYAVIALKQTESQGQVLTGIYWGGLTIGRILAIPASVRIQPAKLLGGSMFGCVLACIVLLFGQSSIGVVWIFSCIFGFFMACIFPTAVALAETYFPVAGADATIFVIGSATGEMILPFIISSLFGDESGHTGDGKAASGAAQRAAEDSYAVGPSIMLWVVTIGCTINLAVYWLLVKRGKALHADLAAAAAAAAGGAAIASAPPNEAVDSLHTGTTRSPLSTADSVARVDMRPIS